MNLLVTRHDKIGDFVTTLPLFKVIKNHDSNIKTFALVSKINYEFAKNFDFIDEVILYDKDDFLGTLKRVKNANIDVSISGFINTQLGLLLFLSGIKTRIAPATKLAQIFFNKKVTQRRSKVEKTEVEYNLDLAHALNKSIKLQYQKPLLNVQTSNEIANNFRKIYNINENTKIVAFHAGFGGSSDGNLSLNDYVALAKKASIIPKVQVVFTFGPDDLKIKEELENKVDFEAIFYESKTSIIDFCKLIASFKVFVSTSTGPMHLAGIVNAKTISFFGDSLFASSKRWSTVSDIKNQYNFMLGEHYEKAKYKEIEETMLELINT